MTPDDLAFMPALELLDHYRKRTLSPVEVTDAILERIERLNPTLSAYITITGDLAREAARSAEAAYAGAAAPGPLAGTPVAIKDLTLTKGVRTTNGSLLYEDWIPDEDTPDVERLKAAGMVMLGKTNTPEYGWKGDSGNRLIGPTLNPWKLSQTAGGSSGGSGAAVAAGLGPLAQGSDGAGSIRIPASFCGIYGLKPTTGLVPRYPSRMSVHSHVGPMTRTVRDAALLLSVTAGADPRDRFSWSLPTDYLAALNPDLTGLRVAWSPDLGYAEVDPQVRSVTEAAARRFSELGCEVEEAHPNAPDPWPIEEVVFAVSQLEPHIDNLPEVQDLLDPGRLELIEYARSIPAAEIIRAQRAWNDYYHVWRRFMDDFDLVLTPTMATTAFTAGDHKPDQINGQPTTYLGWTGFAYPFNLTGQPAATVPCGFSDDGLPIGLQIVGRYRDDQTVLNASAAFEELMPWADKIPMLNLESPQG